MTKRILFLFLMGITITNLCYARRITWIKTEEPPVKLEKALEIAKEELKKNKQIYFYCLGASLGKTFSEGDWQLYFSSKEGKDIWVNVSSDKKVRISEDGFEY